MDTRSVLCFLNLLNQETSDVKDEIATLYEKALDENDDVIQLKKYMNEYLVGAEGKLLLSEGRDALDQLYSDPVSALCHLDRVRHVWRTYEYETNLGREGIILNPLPTDEKLSVLEKAEVKTIEELYQAIVRSGTYLLTVYEGIESVRQLGDLQKQGDIFDLVHRANMILLPLLQNCSNRAPNWLIHRSKDEMFGDSYFELEWVSQKKIETLRQTTIGVQRMNGLSFFDPDALFRTGSDKPVCWGTGNLVSFSPKEVFDRIRSPLLTQLRVPNENELSRVMPPPQKMLKYLSDNKEYVIRPCELLLALNRWNTGHSIMVNKMTHTCLVCGRKIETENLTCGNHFVG